MEHYQWISINALLHISEVWFCYNQNEEQREPRLLLVVSPSFGFRICHSIFNILRALLVCKLLHYTDLDTNLCMDTAAQTVHS